MIAVCALLVLLAPAPAPATEPAGVDRSTPQATMRAMMDSLARGDEAACAASMSFTGDPDGELARATARQMLAQQAYWHAAWKRWGRRDAIDAYVKRGIALPDVYLEWPLARWRIEGEHAFVDRPDGKGPQGLGPLRRVQGQWMWDPFIRGLREKERVSLLARAEAEMAKYMKLAADIEAGKFASIHDAIDVLHPREPREPEQQQHTKEQLDPRTIPGAMLSLGYAAQAEDAAAMTKFFHADGPGGGQLADAHARHILAVHRFILALSRQMDRDSSASRVATEFGLTDPRNDNFGHLITDWKIDGDRATGTNDAGPAAATMRRVDGTWRIDITPPAGGPTPVKLAEELRRRTAIVTAVTSDINEERLFTADEVRRELKRRGLTPATQPAAPGAGAGEGEVDMN